MLRPIGPVMRIIEEIAAAHNITPQTLIRHRSRTMDALREEAYYRVANETEASLNFIAHRFARNHSTVAHGSSRYCIRMGIPLPPLPGSRTAALSPAPEK